MFSLLSTLDSPGLVRNVGRGTSWAKRKEELSDYGLVSSFELIPDRSVLNAVNVRFESARNEGPPVTTMGGLLL